MILLDRQNHHLFQPLLYQVATAGLAASEIAQPIRSILRDRLHVRVHLAEVESIIPAERCVIAGGQRLTYDYLVFALGGRTSYFGHPEWEEFAPGLKSIHDAQRIRRDVLMAFERAENTAHPLEQQQLMTVVVVGGGATGVELAGALVELARHVLRRDFRRIDPSRARIVLVEGAPRLLGTFPAALSENARITLERMGVEVRCGLRVQSIGPGRVEFHTGEVIEAGNVIWAAGIAASALTAQLGAPLDRSGRVRVNPDLSVPGHPEIFVIGDAASLEDTAGNPVPGVSRPPSRRPFTWRGRLKTNSGAAQPASVPVLGQGKHGDHREICGGGEDRAHGVLRLSRVAGVAFGPPHIPRGPAQPDRRVRAMVLQLYHVSPRCPNHLRWEILGVETP